LGDALDDAHGEVNAEDVISNAVAVVVDDLQPLAVVSAVDFLDQGVGILEVLAAELSPGNVIGDVVGLAQLLGTNHDPAVHLVVILEDALQDLDLVGGQLVILTEHAGLVIGILDLVLVGVQPVADADVCDVLVGLVGEVDVLLGGVIALQAGDILALGAGGDVGLSALVGPHGVAGVSDGQNGLAGHIGVTGLAQVLHGGGIGQGVALTVHIQLGLALIHGGGAVQIGILVGDHYTGDVLQLEGIPADGGVLNTVDGGLVAESRSVGGLGHQDGTEQDLGHDLTGGGNAQGAGSDVLGDAALLAHSG